MGKILASNSSYIMSIPTKSIFIIMRPAYGQHQFLHSGIPIEIRLLVNEVLNYTGICFG